MLQYCYVSVKINSEHEIFCETALTNPISKLRQLLTCLQNLQVNLVAAIHCYTLLYTVTDRGPRQSWLYKIWMFPGEYQSL